MQMLCISCGMVLKFWIALQTAVQDLGLALVCALYRLYSVCDRANIGTGIYMDCRPDRVNGKV